MSNSNLVSYTKFSPNHSGRRTHAIDRITPHCVVGQCTAESLGGWFAKSSTQASSNYGIDKNGRIGLYVDEGNRSWCSSSNANDQRAVTIECASEMSSPYVMNDAVYQSLIRLCVDICKRNGKTKLLWFNDKNKSLNYSPKSNEMVLTVHRWFANKSCPGDWLYSRLGDLANKVNAQLSGTTGKITPVEDQKPSTNNNSSVKVGDVIKLKTDAVYINGKSVPGWVLKSTLYARQIRDNGDIVFSTQKTGDITGVISKSQLASSGSNSTGTTANFKVRVTADVLNIRKGPGTSYGVAGIIRDKGIYTIVATSSNWGKLKSGAGWISLNYTKRV